VSLPVVARPVVEREVQGAYEWYEREREGLGEEFLQTVDRSLDIIAEHPDIFPFVHRDIRRAVLKRFPYSVLYRVKSSHIVLVGCFHSKRDPTAWRGRH